MIVWGGYSRVGPVLGTGGVYELRSGSWRPMRSFSSGSAGHTAI